MEKAAADLKTTMTDDSSNLHGKQTSLNTRCTVQIELLDITVIVQDKVMFSSSPVL